MFLIETDDLLIASSISSILKQKGFIHTLEKNEKYFFILKIIKIDKYIELRSSSSNLKIETPTTIHQILDKINILFVNFNLDVNDAKFYPLKQSLIYKNKEAYLGNIHFIIFNKLMLHRETGINKIDLYKEIWPLDKELQLNKLDTHLTNLKNHLKEKINFNFLFFSRSGSVYLGVD
jgi:hypothetical protein